MVDNPPVTGIWSQLTDSPVWVRFAVIGGGASCVAGGLVGLVVGLQHPAAVWFAIPEAAVLMGLPGTVLALVAGAIATVGRAIWRLLRRR
jgi:hypothetical protein